jgi:hypothetical protein
VGGGHVPYPPALIAHAVLDLFEEMLLNFRGCNSFGNSDQIFDGEQPDRVLVVRLEATVDRQTIRNEVMLSEASK